MQRTRFNRTLVAACALGSFFALPMPAGAEDVIDLPDWVPGEWILRAGASISDPQGDGTDLPASKRIEADQDGPQLSGDLTWLFASHWGLEVFTTLPFNHGLWRYDTRGKSGSASSSWCRSR